MTKALDLTKQKFGRLTVIKRVENDKHGKSRWLCKCDCGNEIQVVGIDLKSGHTQSCGCLQKEALLKRTIKHNMSKGRIHRIWSRMKSRCYNEKVIEYKDYGGRGIIICDEWKNNFQSFYDWAISNGYTDELTIDRINNNGNYEPNNCRWVTAKEQARNRRSNHLITYNDKTMCITDWEKELGFNSGIIKGRLKEKWDIEKIFKTPMKATIEKLITYQDITLNLSQWDKKLGFNKDTVWKRLKLGWSIKQALETPIGGDKNDYI